MGSDYDVESDERVGRRTLTRPDAPPAGRGPRVALRSATGAALIAATVLASMVAFLDAFIVQIAVPAIGG